MTQIKPLTKQYDQNLDQLYENLNRLLDVCQSSQNNQQNLHDLFSEIELKWILLNFANFVSVSDLLEKINFNKTGQFVNHLKKLDYNEFIALIYILLFEITLFHNQGKPRNNPGFNHLKIIISVFFKQYGFLLLNQQIGKKIAFYFKEIKISKLFPFLILDSIIEFIKDCDYFLFFPFFERYYSLNKGNLNNLILIVDHSTEEINVEFILENCINTRKIGPLLSFLETIKENLQQEND